MSSPLSAPDPVPRVNADHAADDWLPLLDAVRDRLHRLAGAAADDGRAQAALQACVADCLLALEQVQLELRREFELRKRLEHDLLEARAALGRFTLPRPQPLSFDRCLQP